MMAKQKIVIDPITRIEGHLKIEVEVDNSKVIDARVMGTLWRGIEVILKGRDPRDAQMITQRICGVCPVSHAQAAALNLDSAFKVIPPANGRIIRNLILGSNFIQSHILHFYHLAILDYVQGDKIAPFVPRYKGDYLFNNADNATLMEHYLQALDMRAKAHELAAVWSGKMPMAQSITPGGVSQSVSVDKIAASLWRIRQLKQFINQVYLPDVMLLAKVYKDYKTIGSGYNNFLSYGVFAQDDQRKNLFFKPGRFVDNNEQGFNPDKITEDVTFSWYKSAKKLRPVQAADTAPDINKDKAYSWVKAPRYDGLSHEVGPLARMWINGDYHQGVSLIDRHIARALETKKIIEAMENWLSELIPGKPVFNGYKIPKSSQGIGLTEAPRGALGHWIKIENSKISNYQCIVPTTWNCSPRDHKMQLGPMEQALINTPVADPDNPIEVVRVVRSFDPCLACAVHLINPSGKMKQFRVC
ncbi:MAG: nickel-dependent hydrogenase large subunit [Candidatus Omnitrophota bacterium]